MSEGLYVPEEHLLDVCRVLRRGLEALSRSNRGRHEKAVPREVRQQLLKWCKESEEYMRDSGEVR